MVLGVLANQDNIKARNQNVPIIILELIKNYPDRFQTSFKTVCDQFLCSRVSDRYALNTFEKKLNSSNIHLTEKSLGRPTLVHNFNA